MIIKIIKNFIFISLLCFGLGIIFFFVFLLPSMKTEISIQKYQTNMSSILINSAIKIADNHTYILGKYDCSQFSRDLVIDLKNKGINAYCVTGYVNLKNESMSFFQKLINGHTWVEVNIEGDIIGIEATSGFIIPSNIYNERYISQLKGYCL